MTLGCARNEVDSEELAGRLAADGWTLVADAADADVALVNTCGFVAAAKKDSIDAVLEAADAKAGGTTRAVVAVGCLAERYGDELASALPEADAVLGFDDYDAISARLASVLAGEAPAPHVPRDRRTLLPASPQARHAATSARPGSTVEPGSPLRSGTRLLPVLEREPVGLGEAAPGGRLPSGPAAGPVVMRRRLDGGPAAPLKLASGCDRRCAFCAIPAFRGSFLSRRPAEVLGEARWLADQGVRELVLVSENSTSYGKDLGDLRLLETLLPELAAVPGILRVRVSYLQPAETRPGLVRAIASTPGVAPYFDLSFQHSSASVLRRMRRFGDTDRFLELLASIRSISPQSGARSNVIVGFPGETEDDLAELERFLTEARLDAVGVFGYSDEDGTEAAGYDAKVPEEVVAQRVDRLSRLTEELTAQRAEERVGETVEVLVETLTGDGVEGRAAHQAPEVDGVTLLQPSSLIPAPKVGDLVRATVVASEGVDLVAVPRP